MVEDFNTPFSIIDGKKRQKIIKDVLELNNTNHQVYLIDIYRTLHQKQQNPRYSQLHTE